MLGIERHLMARPEVTADKTRELPDGHRDIEPPLTLAAAIARI
jgi:hypothetical protein